MAWQLRFGDNHDLEDDIYSPTFKQPYPNAIPSGNSTKVDIGFSPEPVREFWESAIVSNIIEKNESRVVKQDRTGISDDLQLYRNPSRKINGRQFNFENIPPPYPYCSQASEIVKEIYNKRGNASVEKSYQSAKERQAHKTTLQPPKADNHPSKSLIINPKDFYMNFDDYSKSQKQYSKEYARSLERTCFQKGITKPFQSSYCVSNYMHTQICPSGLATHKFISAQAKKRLSLMSTQTMECKAYPFSPRTKKELQEISQKKAGSRLRIDRIKSRKDSVYDEYKEVLLGDVTTVTSNFLKQYQQFKQKKSKVYGSRMEEIDDVVDYMKREKADIETAFDIVMDIHDKKKPPATSTSNKRKYHRKRPATSAAVMTKI